MNLNYLPPLILALVGFVLPASFAEELGHPTSVVKLDAHDKTIDVSIDGQPFTTFDYGKYNKPILFPILGPGQIGMTRNWPMVKEIDGESPDHPHHKSMWFSHHISGVNFWTEKGGAVKTLTVELPGKTFDEKNGFRTTSSWVRKKNGNTILSDRTTYRFGKGVESRWIDCEINFMASHGNFVFDDSKEGLFAIRTHPDLRLKANRRRGVAKVFGTARNSAGETGPSIWGKRAKWVLYQGPIDSTPMSIAMYDHPNNLRHPTTWHARDYGLVAANPFGWHDFQGTEKGAGAFVVKNKESLTLRYRVEFIKGIASAEGVERRYGLFCGSGAE